MRDSRYDKSDEGVTSLEEVMVKHLFFSLDDLRMTWKDGFNSMAFTLNIMYLIRVLPNREKQKEVLEKWGKAAEDLKAIEGLKLSDDERVAYAGMEVVTEVMLFICQAFDLVTDDIIGPATSRQFRDAVITIPDPVESPEAEVGSESP